MMLVESLDEFEKQSKEILFRVSQDRVYLRQLVLQVATTPSLFALSAHYDAVDKIVLWNSEDHKMQLRLHIYAGGDRSLGSSQADIAQAHNHRWNFSSLILSGGYRHTIYRKDKELNLLIPGMIRQESVGNCYTLHHSQYHSIEELPNTVSLLVRGSLEKESFQVINEKGGEMKWREGSSLNNPTEIAQKKMSYERYQMAVDQLINLEVI
ncbi:MAG: hypothetical protein V4494_01060 [Chlamydiota bacterium]